MDKIHKLLNIVIPPVTLIFIIFFLPPFLIYKFLHSIKRSKCIENVAGKVVLITGASSGIGEHLAYEYARRGARLALAARREDRLKKVADKALELGSPDAIVISADVSKVEDCERIVEETVNHFGQLNHLVNNAGVLHISLFEDFTQFSDIRSIMDTNFLGSVYCTYFAVPHLRKASKGKIIVLSSSAGWITSPRMSIYCASKAAQTSFFETLKAELGRDIGITIVTPGLIESEMTSSQVISKGRLDNLPLQSVEWCTKSIVDSACRGDLYLTEPSWFRVGFWLKVFFPEFLMDYMHFMMISRPWTSNKDA
ncbi:11-beta-hydroxysteroid dehydrogenase A-like [Ziziphus jujuba]|uniref:11-beta-hydroxysteroid dehydrogenase A-like n=1 Tax=Ziziphus jujuba TaxID=326968 RepID=A0A6P6G7J9_ZIZJJ|nr:11-beta-hydroxysteroid dehydrogenase A-like [Ziziphus jujuba]